MPDFQENPPHPLFPPADEDEDDSPSPMVSEILIQRAEQGKKVTSPRMFRGEELMSLNDLFALYGGGDYELIARHNGRITARRRYTIPGPMKPMYDEGPDAVTHETKKPVQAQVLNPMQAMMGGEGSIMSLVMMMMQQMMQQQAQAQQSQTQMFLAMITGGSERSKEEREAQRQEFAANIERERVSTERTLLMMREMMSNKGGSGEEFSRGVEFYRSFANAQIEMARATAKDSGDEGLEGILGTLMQAFQGFQAFQEMKSQGGSPAAAAGAAAAEVIQ